MNDVSSWVSIACKTAIVLLVVNEARGLVLAAPVMWTMYHSGGTLIALWLGFCSLLGIALTVVLPLLAAKAFRRNGQFLVEQGSVHKNSQQVDSGHCR